MTIEEALKDKDASIRAGNRYLYWDTSEYVVFERRLGNRNVPVAKFESLERALDALIEES